MTDTGPHSETEPPKRLRRRAEDREELVPRPIAGPKPAAAQTQTPAPGPAQTAEAAPKAKPKPNNGAEDAQARAKTDPGAPPAKKGGGQNAGQNAGQNPGKKKNAGNNNNGGGGGKRPTPKVVEVAPIARPARMRRRHWGLLFSLLMLVIAPLAATGWYLWERAEDQYASVVGFTVRQEDGGGAADVLSGLGALGGTGATADTDILYKFIQSSSMVSEIDARFDLRTLYAAPFERDPVFALWPDASLEDLVEYWSRILRISYDANARLIELQVLAFDPETAQEIAQDVLDRSQRLINELNAQARSDTIQYARQDLAEAQLRLRDARAALIVFRTRTGLVDLESDLAGRLGVVNTLQQQLAEALVEYDLLIQSTNENDPRVVQASRRIAAIRSRIEEERQNVLRGTSTSGEDYPTLLAEYEALLVDREFAEESYRAALTALDVARADASRQSRYLATYVAPTLPQTAEFPRRMTLFGLTALFLTLTWAILALIYYSIRDSR